MNDRLTEMSNEVFNHICTTENIKPESEKGKALLDSILKEQSVIAYVVWEVGKELFKCDGKFTRTIPILKSFNLTEQEMTDAIQILNDGGAYCDCEVCLNASDVIEADQQYRNGNRML